MIGYQDRSPCNGHQVTTYPINIHNWPRLLCTNTKSFYPNTTQQNVFHPKYIQITIIFMNGISNLNPTQQNIFYPKFVQTNSNPIYEVILGLLRCMGSMKAISHHHYLWSCSWSWTICTESVLSLLMARCFGTGASAAITLTYTSLRFQEFPFKCCQGLIAFYTYSHIFLKQHGFLTYIPVCM